VQTTKTTTRSCSGHHPKGTIGRIRSTIKSGRNSSYSRRITTINNRNKYSNHHLVFSSNFDDDINSIYDGIDDQTILDAYTEWKREYDKDIEGRINTVRFENFKRNYIRLQATNAEELQEARANGQPEPIPLRLNEYADLSADEYQALTATKQQQQEEEDIENRNYQTTQYRETKTSAATVGATTISVASDIDGNINNDETGSEERIRLLYRQWCDDNSRQYDETRIPIFTKNLRAVESFRREQPGKNAAMNRYADLSPDEYRTAIMMEQQSGEGSQSPPQAYNSNSDVVPPTPLTGYTASSSSYLNNLSSSTTAATSTRSTTTSTRTNVGSRNTGSSYLDNISGQMPTLSSPFSPPPSVSSSSPSAEDRIREIYQNWCKYYNKLPNERRLQTFADNLVILEKHYRDTGEQLTLNQYADQLGFEQRIIDDARRSAAEVEAKQAAELLKQRQMEQAEAEAKLREQQREEKRRQAAAEAEQRRRNDEEDSARKRRQQEDEQGRQAEQARLEEERRHAEEARLEAERKQAEQDRLEALRRQAEETRLAEERQREEARRRFEQESRLQAEQTKSVDEARPYEERRREEAASLQAELWDDEQSKLNDVASTTNYETMFTIVESEEEEEEEEEIEDQEPIILPRSSYMDAVAKTWVDRSAYLRSLKEEQSALARDIKEKKEPVQPKAQQTDSKRSQTLSLVDSIWNVMNTPSPSSTNLQGPEEKVDEKYASSLIREADQMIAVSFYDELDVIP
jgi:Cathepsin propeptide inhibitor domain (I29)